MSDTHLRFSRCAEEIFKCVLSLLCGIKRQQAHEFVDGNETRLEGVFSANLQLMSSPLCTNLLNILTYRYYPDSGWMNGLF